MAVPHPIPYQGSKRGLAATILRYFPATFNRLIEPFAGSAAMSLATAHAGRAARFLLGDANEPLIDLWDSILHQPQQLSEGYRIHWQAQKDQEKEYYNSVRDCFNTTKRPEDFLYLLARCVKASVRYNTRGEFNQGPDNRRSGASPDTMAYHIACASQLLAGKTALVRGDYRVTLAQAQPGDVVYMDPPYQGVCGRRNPRYAAQLESEDFIDALNDLNRRGISFLVSYDGRTEDKKYGEVLPAFLQLRHLEVSAGRSTQATLLGRAEETFESLYLSPALCEQVPDLENATTKRPTQMSLVLEQCLTKTYQPTSLSN